MKKFITYIILFISLFLFSKNDVFAASSKITITGSKTVVVGDTVKLTITLSSADPLGSWEFDVKYDSSKLTFVSSTLDGSTHALSYVTNNKTKSKTYTITFKVKDTKKSTSTTVSIVNALVFGFDEKKMNNTSGSINLNIITKADLIASYSSNNYLKSLSIDDYDLTPKFDKNTLEYSLEVENDVREIRVNASKEDSKAKVEGAGKIKLNEGDNKVTISVTAQNGNIRNYIINVTVKELNPVFVKVGDKDLSVVRKIEGLSIPSTYKESTTLIDEEEVPCFESDITGYRLLALRDEESTNFYIANEDGTYTLYEELKFNSTVLYPIEASEIPDNFEEIKVSIDDKEYVLYTVDDGFPLIYGVNVETGDANWYRYDEKENTLQRYIEIKEKEESNPNLMYLVMLLGGSLGITIFFMILLYARYRRLYYKKEVQVEQVK